MHHKAVYLLFCKFTLHVSGVNHTNHQQYTKLGYWSYFCAATSLQRGQGSLATLEGGSCTNTGGCSYSFCTPDDGCG